MSASLTITVAVGTRPEVIKLAPVVAALRAAGHHVRCVATGQHSDPLLYADLFAELGCVPDAAWLLEGSEGNRVGQLLTHAFTDVEAHPPDVVLVLGDTYTAPLVAMAARRAGVGVVHLEAGLRSFNERSMEESNRRMAAALATLHLAPTELAADFLRREGVSDARIRVVGNSVLDAIVSTGVARRGLGERSGVLLTAHRATNVDDPVRLQELATIVRGLAERPGGVLFPVHPRTRDRLRVAGLWDELFTLPGARLVDPLPYTSMLRALSACAVAVTDSGGLQEEASYLGVPVVVMRSTTPRWEGVETGAAVLCGLDAVRVLATVDRLTEPEELARVAALPCPYGDGHTAGHVVAALADEGLRALLTPRDPELAAGGIHRRHPGKGVRAVCVDLDDTLFAQAEWLAGAWTAVSARADTLGIDGTKLHGLLTRVAAEGSDRGGIIDRALVALGVQPAPYVAALVGAFGAHAPPRLTPYPGVRAALERLHAVVPVVLITDGNPRIQQAKIAALGLGGLVDHVVISDDLGGRAVRKPHPASFQRALSLLDMSLPGVSASDVVHIGDRPAKDVAGAHGVDMRSLRVRTGEYAALPDPAGLAPWMSANSFQEAVELLIPLLEPSRVVASPGQREQAAREQTTRERGIREHGEPVSRL